MTDPVKWALIDLLKLLNGQTNAQHEKLEGIAALLGVDIHHSRASGEWPSGPDTAAADKAYAEGRVWIDTTGKTPGSRFLNDMLPSALPKRVKATRV